MMFGKNFSNVFYFYNYYLYLKYTSRFYRRRRLPLIHPSKASFDVGLMEKPDKRNKMVAKQREVLRRGARKCRVKPRDSVVIERHVRAKRDTRFDPQRFTLMEEENGSLNLCSEAG